MNWAELRTQVLRTILNDPNGSIYKSESLLDAVAWALDTFAAHTAPVSSMVIEVDGSTTQFALPSNIFVPLDIAGSVYTTTDSVRSYYAPTLSGEIPERQYDIVGDNILFLTAPDTDVTLRYFASYAAPTGNSDTVAIPHWGRMPVAYLTAAHALLNRMTENVQARALPEKASDMGGPEDSAYRAQYTFLLSQTNSYLARFPTQSRVLFLGNP